MPPEVFKGVLLTVSLCLGVAVEAVARSSDQDSAYLRDFGYVEMPDGVGLAYVTYLPPGEGPFPTILVYEPYQGAGSDPEQRSRRFVNLWLEAGYAYVGANARLGMLARRARRIWPE